MSTRNNCNFICRLANDPATRFFEGQSGKANSVTRFRVAVVAGFGDYEESNFFDVEFWGARGEAIAERFKTGGQIGITAELTMNRFEGTDGPVEKPLLKGVDWSFAGETEGKGGSSGDRPQGRSQGGYSSQNRGGGDRPQQRGGNGRSNNYNQRSGGGTRQGGQGRSNNSDDLGDWPN